jgi:uncharacterized DUF497 family protein
MSIMDDLRFQWDARKNAANRRKHGVSFDEAKTVFFDEDAVEYPDPDHSKDEDRFLMIGRSFRLRVLLVCHCYRASESAICIVSARKATRKEREVHLQGARR